MSKQDSSINNYMTMNESTFDEHVCENVDNGNNCSVAISNNLSSSSSMATTGTSTQEDILQNTSLTIIESTPKQQQQQHQEILVAQSTTNYISTTDTSDVINESIDNPPPSNNQINIKGDDANIGSRVLDGKLETSIKKPIDYPTNSPSIDVTNKDLMNCTKNKTLHNFAKPLTEVPVNQVKITLVDEKLWEKFHSHVNEMIVTKDGRRMFPVLKIKVDGLDPSSMYTVTIDFSVSDAHRWKFMNGRWIRGNKEDNIKNSSTYMHCDSPNFGSFWMNNTVSFAKLKISNKVSKDPSKIQIHSLFRYLPCIHIYSIDSVTRSLTHVITKHFENTEFVAVTAYQNDAITRLKVSYNPFAKAFLDVKRSGSNDSPISSYNNSGGGSSGHCNNRGFNSMSNTSTATSNTNTNINSSNSSHMPAYHKQMGNVTEDSYNSLATNVNPFLYQQNLSQDSGVNVSQNTTRHLRQQPCNAVTPNNSTSTTCNAGNNNNLNEMTASNSSNSVVNPTNLPHYYDYLQSTSESCAFNSRMNVEARNNSLLSLYDNNGNYKGTNYPYGYQYSCPNNYYYDKAYLPPENSGYFYAVKTENTTPQSITPSSHTGGGANNQQNNNSGVVNNCNTNRPPPINTMHQYNYNYQNTPLFYNKDVKFHEKNPNPKSSYPSHSVRDDKRTTDP